MDIEYIKKARLRILWEESGGLAGAKARLKWAEEYLKKEKREIVILKLRSLP